MHLQNKIIALKQNNINTLKISKLSQWTTTKRNNLIPITILI